VRLDPLESLAALTDPIPDQGRHLVRTYGWYSNKKRGMRKKRLPSAAETGGGQVADAPERCSVPDGSSDDDFRKECRRTWARMIKKIYEVDPLICPRCGFPMRVLSVIEDPPVNVGRAWRVCPSPPPRA